MEMMSSVGTGEKSGVIVVVVVVVDVVVVDVVVAAAGIRRRGIGFISGRRAKLATK
jgi:hypothetical protein